MSKHPATVPKWAIIARENNALAEMANSPFVGVALEDDTPRLPTRILPSDHSCSLSAQSTAETIITNQKIVQFAGYEAAMGVQADFSDLRRLPAEVKKLTRLKIEPFLEGSLVICGVLSNEVHEVLGDTRHRKLTGRDVLEQTHATLSRLAESVEAPNTCIGMMHAVRDLGHILKREADAIEYYNNSVSTFKPIRFEPNSIRVLEDFLEEKLANTPIEFRGEITGRVTAVDLVKRTFQLTLESGSVVSGTYSDFIRSTAVHALGEKAKVVGEVQYVANVPQHITAYSMEVIFEDLNQT